jgi:predicted TIM-barrel fold metal-dependent hydrolase
VRENLNHPVIDGDGHVQEYHPIFIEYFREVAGPTVTQRYLDSRLRTRPWYVNSPEERYEKRIYRPPFWTMPAKNTLDLATAMLPDLFRARLDDMGIDFAVVYTSQFHILKFRDEEIRRAGCRAVNLMNRDQFAKHGDRMTPAAVIPLVTPQEGIDELNFCVRELGLKTAMISGVIERPVPIVQRNAPDLARYTTMIDSLCLDSAYDYDPFWQACLDLKISPTTHASGQGWGSRQSISNYTFNHIGAFGASHEAFCKALFLGGVTQRFPQLRFGFLEGGVNWAVSVYNDLFEHWEKRNINALHKWLDPKQVDRVALGELVEKYGGARFAPYLEKIKAPSLSSGARPSLIPEGDDYLDDWKNCKIETKKDIYENFIPRFFFGCEADDSTIAHAFNGKCNKMGAKLNAVFSSDVSHWDVPDMTETLAEAYELVEHKLLSDDDFRDFTFANMVRLQAGLNRDFFKGTKVEKEAQAVLDGDAAKA